MLIMNIFKKSKKEQLQTLDVGEVKTAVLEIKPQIVDSCSSYDIFGLCTVSDCLQCENCAYRISFDNGKTVETDDFEENSLISKTEKYFLEFVEPVGKDIYGYLTDDYSDYGIIRVNDKVVLRSAKEKQLKEYGYVLDRVNKEVDQANRNRLVLTKK